MQVEINTQEASEQLEKCPNWIHLIPSQVLEGGVSDKKYPGAQLTEKVLKSELRWVKQRWGITGVPLAYSLSCTL